MWPFKRDPVPLERMPDDSFGTIRRLSDDDLHRLMEGQKPHSARYIAASREVQWRQDRTRVLLQAGTLAIALISLAVSIVALAND
jgi:hypothetical protein